MFSLTSKQHKIVNILTTQYQQKLFELADGLGSPLHLLFPQVFEENICEYLSVIERHHVNTSLYFAKKANKSSCFIESCARKGVGVDVATHGELCEALSGGLTGSSITVSGVGKSKQLYEVAIFHGCLIAIDNAQELEEIIAYAQKLEKNTDILLRIRCEQNSRFGFDPKYLSDYLEKIKTSRLVLRGFSFHLSGYDLASRSRSIADLIPLCLQAQATGLKECNTINAGGGIPVSYCDPEDWEKFQDSLQEKHFHANKQFSGYYPYGNDIASSKALEKILTYPVTDEASLNQMLKEHNLNLMFELGRALLDQSGISLFEVKSVKQCDDYHITTVLGSSFHLSEQWFNSEFLPDPILIPHMSRLETGKAVSSCIAGGTCLESDMLTWRKVSFKQIPKSGDLIAYINTAGYQMDSNESTFHNMPIPNKVVIRLRDDDVPEYNQLEWQLDNTQT